MGLRLKVGSAAGVRDRSALRASAGAIVPGLHDDGQHRFQEHVSQSVVSILATVS
jgi:hypothetical protein